jgi:hypothetical protein
VPSGCTIKYKDVFYYYYYYFLFVCLFYVFLLNKDCLGTSDCLWLESNNSNKGKCWNTRKLLPERITSKGQCTNQFLKDCIYLLFLLLHYLIVYYKYEFDSVILPNPNYYEYVWNNKNETVSGEFGSCVPYVNLVTCDGIQTKKYLFVNFCFLFILIGVIIYSC